MTARERRQVVEQVQAVREVSERRAIRYTGFPRSTMRYRSIRDPQEVLRARIVELAQERPRWGYRMIHVMLRREGQSGEPETGSTTLQGGRTRCAFEGKET